MKENLNINESIEVKPLSTPIGLLYYMDFKYIDYRKELGGTEFIHKIDDSNQVQ